MSALRVGMRVKKVRGSHNVGATARVVETDPGREFDIRLKAETRMVAIRGPRAGQIVLPGDAWAWSRSGEWEPILPEGWRTVEWSDCLWQPESERVPIYANGVQA